MGLRDRGRDVEAQSQALLVAADRAALEGLEDPLQDRCRDRLACVGDRKLEGASVGKRFDPDGSIVGAMGQGVGDQVRDELPDTVPVAVDGFDSSKIDQAVRLAAPEKDAIDIEDGGDQRRGLGGAA